jgi:phenylalanyl-tRNA synthetase beta chain
MQIPLKWINELVNVESIHLDDLIEKLTLGGFEVEEIIELEIDGQTQLALDISATANRSDSLSIQGICTEIAALLNKPITLSNYSLQTATWKQQFFDYVTTISNEENVNCSTLLAIIIENITDFTVPKWLKQKLISSDIIPENNLRDFQNYILLETGYPFAFYDFEKICSKLDGSNFQLSISNATNGQTFTAMNDKIYELNSSNLLLKADHLPLSIVGIIENKDFQILETTTSLLIEGSIFNAATIRQQSRTLGLRTDRSARYEKSIKSTYLMESIYRFISLLRISNPNLNCKLHTFHQTPEQEFQPIRLRYQTISEILGPINNSQKAFDYLTPEKITEYLNRLNFEFSYDNSKFNWEVQIPHSRSEDITREIDLIEEIGRLHGFNNFVTTLPKLKVIGNEDPSYKTRKKITSCLLNLGFNELIHYSLVSEKTFLENQIQLVNPLLSDCSNLRSSLLPNLIKTVQENLKQGNSFIEGFEYGHVFSGDIGAKFEEKEYVAGIFGGIQTKLTWSESERALSWFEAKGKMEQFFQQLNLSTDWQNLISETDTIMHPYRSSEISLINGVKLGRFGQIHPILANQFVLSSQIYLFEFDLEVIKDQLQKNKLVLSKEYSLYPKIVKDLSFIIRQDIKFEKLQEALYCNGTKFLSDIHLLDEYRGKSIPEGSTSLCLQLVFQSKEKTLETKEVENIMNHLQFVLSNKFDALIRN